MVIPVSAVNAVALWLEGIDPYGAEHGFSAVDETFWVQGVSLHNLLSAAEPHIREAIAQEIESIHVMDAEGQRRDGKRMRAVAAAVARIGLT